VTNQPTGMEPSRVLVIEDDPALCQLVTEEITELGFRTRRAGNAEEGAALMASWAPDLVVSDLRLPGAGGLQVLRHSRGCSPVPSFIVITAFGTVAQAVEALRQGADDFLTKPLDLDHLRLAVSRVLERRRVHQELLRVQELIGDDGFHGMLGRSRPMQRLFSQITQVARGAGPVLIAGESGVGKELVARAIHAEGPLASRTFLAVNCAGIPEHLIESEFFGHTAGAFTGAIRSRKGLFLEAAGGTLLLDEIADLPLPTQAKLLRVLQEGTVRAVGADAEKPVDVRILAATNRDLEVEVQSGSLREDLFYRLETFMVRVPPLREREDDLELLAGRFLNRFARQLKKDVHGMSPAALDRLRGYSFPGNVRELQSAMERAVTFCDGSTVQIEDLPARIQQEPPAAERLFGDSSELSRSLLGEGPVPTLAEMEARYIRYVVEQVKGNKRRAAAILGIGRGTLYRRFGEGSTNAD